MSGISTKPYLIRAIHEWCTDSGYRPYIAVAVDENTIVPREFVRNGEIVLNVSAAATNRLRITNELIEFEARFGGVAHSVSIPIDNVSAIYAQETGHGMAFEVPKALALVPEPAGDTGSGVGATPSAPEDAGASAEQGAAGADATRSRRRPKLAAVPSGAGSASAEPAAATPAEAGAQAPAAAKAPRRRRKEAAPAEEGQAGKTGPTPLAPVAAPSKAGPSKAGPSEAGQSAAGQSAAGPAGAGGESAPSGDGPDGKPPAGRPRLTRVK